MIIPGDDHPAISAVLPLVAAVLVGGAAFDVVGAAISAYEFVDHFQGIEGHEIQSFLTILASNSAFGTVGVLIGVGLLAVTSGSTAASRPVLVAALMVVVPVAISAGVAAVLVGSDGPTFEPFANRAATALALVGRFAIALAAAWLAFLLLRDRPEEA